MSLTANISCIGVKALCPIVFVFYVFYGRGTCDDNVFMATRVTLIRTNALIKLANVMLGPTDPNYHK